MNLPAPILSPPSRLAPSLARSPTDLERSRDLARIKIIATTLLVFSVVVAFAARLLESRHWSLGYVAAWAEAAAVGGLADWYAVVALFRHPCGIPFPHTAIISNNRERIAESFGDFVEEQFLAPDPIEQKLKSVDFAELALPNGWPTRSGACRCRDLRCGFCRKPCPPSRKPDCSRSWRNMSSNRSRLSKWLPLPPS